MQGKARQGARLAWALGVGVGVGIVMGGVVN